ASAKSDTLKQEINKTLEFYRVLATEMLARYENETVVVVCSGSSNEFCLEDWLFYTFITLSNELERLGDERFSTFCLSLLSRGWKEQCQ
ncbi:hypothetical protein ACFPTR_10695, partial [Aliibacillus thermotolerans]